MQKDLVYAASCDLVAPEVEERGGIRVKGSELSYSASSHDHIYLWYLI